MRGRLASLRKELKARNLDAYIVPHEDAKDMDAKYMAWYVVTAAPAAYVSPERIVTFKTSEGVLGLFGRMCEPYSVQRCEFVNASSACGVL